MKKLLLSLGVIGTFILYSLQQKDEASNVHVVPPVQSSFPTPLPTDTQSSSSSVPPPQNPTPTLASVPPVQTGQYKDGTYTGIVTDAYYGPYQVAAVIAGGKITDINFLQYPNDRGTSIAINTQAMPYLKQEAIQAQSAQVDIVGGATDSSRAFIQSLKSALLKAH